MADTEPVIAGDGMKVILHNLHTTILTSLTVGKMVSVQSECKSLTTPSAFSVCERVWDGENRPNVPEIISWGIPEYLIKNYLLMLFSSPSLSLSNHLFSSKSVEQSWLSLLDLCSTLPSQKVCCTTGNVIKWRSMALLSIFEILGLMRERMVHSVIQKSLQIVFSHPGPTRN